MYIHTHIERHTHTNMGVCGFFPGPQTLNNGVVLLRNSVRGRFFLEMLLEKAGRLPRNRPANGAQSMPGALLTYILAVFVYPLSQRP